MIRCVQTFPRFWQACKAVSGFRTGHLKSKGTVGCTLLRNSFQCSLLSESCTSPGVQLALAECGNKKDRMINLFACFGFTFIGKPIVVCQKIEN